MPLSLHNLNGTVRSQSSSSMELIALGNSWSNRALMSESPSKFAAVQRIFGSTVPSSARLRSFSPRIKGRSTR